MTHRLPAHTDSALPAALMERLRSLGAAVWRLDIAGTIMAEPEQPGILGLWLRSGHIARLISRAAPSWEQEEAPGLTELFPGCWLLPLPEVLRRRRVGYTVALLLGEAATEASEVGEACRTASLSPPVVRRAIAQTATFSRCEAERTLSILRWMSDDLCAQRRIEQTLEGFTVQLSDAYETINALYSVGRSMSQLEDPSGFVRQVLARLHDTMSFGWVAGVFPNSDRLPESVAGRRFVVGQPSLEPPSFARWLEEASRGELDSDSPTLIGDDEGIPPELGPQIVLQPIERDGVQYGVLAAGEKAGLDNQVNSYETLLIEAASGYVTAFLENVKLYADQRATFIGTIKAVTASIDAKDHYTRGHSERVAHLSAEIARAMGIDEAQVERIHIAGLVHDVGKIGVPEHVLCKPGRLSDEEFGLIRLHPEIGHGILKDIPLLRDVLPGVLHHHERWDGGGYPHGLAGEDTPLMARIIGLADTFDAMSSTRSYRPAMEREKVLAEIRRCAGSQFDPSIVPHFFGVDLSAYDSMVREHAARGNAPERDAA